MTNSNKDGSGRGNVIVVNPASVVKLVIAGIAAVALVTVGSTCWFTIDP